MNILTRLVVASGLCAVMLSFTAQTASARPDTSSYTCEGLRQLIRARGAVVMNTKNRRVYRRLVADRRFCSAGYVLGWYTTPTRSGPCRVYICEQRLDDDVRTPFRRGF